MDKPLLCGKTGKGYKFRDNLIYHYKNLYPLYDKKVDFDQYTSVHDDWMFTKLRNLKLHNKVCHFEQVCGVFVCLFVCFFLFLYSSWKKSELE